MDLCCGCLRKQIHDDFSGKITFCYGISDSAIPFASSAVVQIDITEENNEICSISDLSDCVSYHFVLSCVSKDQSKCLVDYIDGHCHVKESRYGNGPAVWSGLSQSQTLAASIYSYSHLVSLSKDGMQLSDSISTGDLVTSANLDVDCLVSSLWPTAIAALAPVAYVGIGSYDIVKDVVQKYLSGTLEDSLLSTDSTLDLHLEKSSSSGSAPRFLRSVAMPECAGLTTTPLVRHPNIIPVLGMIKMHEHHYILQPKAPYTLKTILHYSPKVVKSDWHIRFLMYQILSAVNYIHELGLHHGAICPANILLTDTCWTWVNIFSGTNVQKKLNLDCKYQPMPKVCCSKGSCTSQFLYADLKLSHDMDWQLNFRRWWSGDLSNYDYLLFLNRLAGRRWGDHIFHVVMPWVIDFTIKPDENSDLGWRDLRKSKWRLTKGDEQLDFTYTTSEIPHHISDECLSELAVCSYKARRLPLNLLRSAVRSVYEPNEYPSSMQRLYQWTPDECIPEFYSDPQIFVSNHCGMIDLAIPHWASCAEEFIKIHRACLESPRVSREIHHWIDIIFGYKMSGEAAVAAKNVMLHTANSAAPRSMGRRQLFTHPHPMRSAFSSEFHSGVKLFKAHEKFNSGMLNEVVLESENLVNEELKMPGLAYMEEVEAVGFFREEYQSLSPVYNLNEVKSYNSVFLMGECDHGPSTQPARPCITTSAKSLDLYEEVDSDSRCFHDLLLWQNKSHVGLSSEHTATDIFSAGCVLAELYMMKPLFNPLSLTSYDEVGDLLGLTNEFPSDVELFLKIMLQRDWKRRPSAKSLLESPFFPASVRLAYLYLSSLNMLAGNRSRLEFAAKLAKEGYLKSMGPVAAEICTPVCLLLVMASQSDVEAESALLVLVELLKCLQSNTIKALVLPSIQKILQAVDCSHLKVALLQNSFIREIWSHVGKQLYLEKVHPFIISNLSLSSHKNSAAAASVLLVGSCEELGIPVTVHQTVLPLIHYFGKGLGADGIDTLVRIGTLFGENFIVQQYLPLLKNFTSSCIDGTFLAKPEPVQSWISLALIDCLVTLDGLILSLPGEVVLRELVQDSRFLHARILGQPHVGLHVHQIAASALLSLCKKIGPDATSEYVLPHIKDIFDEFAFSCEKMTQAGPIYESVEASKSKPFAETQIENRSDLVWLLYPSLASLLGIEKLRRCCGTWLLVEQYLERYHNWKGDCKGDVSWSGQDGVLAQRLAMSSKTSEYNPAKLLLNGVGWSIPQLQNSGRGSKSLVKYKQPYEVKKESVLLHDMTHAGKMREPWSWFPCAASRQDGPDFLGCVGNIKEELPWKIKASILHSVQAHPGTLKTLAVCHDECTIFTGGVGPGFKGTVQMWELPRMDCISGYYGHEEVVNDMCILSINGGRMASCDGTIHVWNSFTGKLISLFTETSVSSLHFSKAKADADQSSMINVTPHGSSMLANTFDGSLYTCMHYTQFDKRLVVGMGNGFLRSIDLARGQKLNLWKSESSHGYSLSSLVSSICSCNSEKLETVGASVPSSWISVGTSSGQIRLLDERSGSFVTSWQAHDGHITKLASPESHLLISSSLDKTLRLWDLRRNGPSQACVFKGHSDAIPAFSVWGRDVISVSGNKIGLCSLSGSTNEEAQKWLSLRKLYAADRGARNLSSLSSISILPFSRLFLVGTEDGFLKICT